MAISPGMKKRIRNGQYEFPAAEWSRVSEDGTCVVYCSVLFVFHPRNKKFNRNVVSRNLGFLYESRLQLIFIVRLILL